MMAVFESRQPHLKIDKSVIDPDRGKDEGSYIFSIGLRHNILILKEPYEVELFRRYIENRPDISEIGALSVR